MGGGSGGGYVNARGEVEEKACPCGAGSCLVLTSNTPRNPGRQFYKCPLRVSVSCQLITRPLRLYPAITCSKAACSNAKLFGLACECCNDFDVLVRLLWSLNKDFIKTSGEFGSPCWLVEVVVYSGSGLWGL